MAHKTVSIFVCLLLLASCKSPEARKPVKKSSGSFITQSATRNKKLYQQEEARITQIIAENSQQNYLASEHGFWYYYTVKDTTTNLKPKYGDLVTFTYNIKDLEGRIVLSENENGLQAYKIDQSNQDLISGIRDGIKLMKTGETITFLFPSYKAYGYYGIENKLGANIPVQSTVTLKSIKQSQEN